MALGNECFENQLNGRDSVRIAVPWFRRLVPGILPWRPGFHPRPAHVEFVVDKVALGQAFRLPVSFRQFSLLIVYLSPTI
jgi:hypothetical protein